jgi:SP family sugar:H+ symporter-like MFS transporter
MTARGWQVAFYASLGAMIFGYDTAWWSGVLGMPAFTSRFGDYNPTTKTYAIPAPLQSSGKPEYCPAIYDAILTTKIRKWHPNCW